MKTFLTLKALLIGGAVSVAAYVGYATVASPYQVIAEIRRGMQEGKPDVLRQHIDFEALRESIKGQINAGLMGNVASTDDENRGLATFGALLVGVLVGPMVDLFITPEAIVMMAQGEKPKGRGKSSKSRKKAEEQSFEHFQGQYEAWNRFVVSVPSEDGKSQVDFVFNREQMTEWKLSALRMPTDWLAH